MSTNDNNDEFLFNIDDEDFNFGEDGGDGGIGLGDDEEFMFNFVDSNDNDSNEKPQNQQQNQTDETASKSTPVNEDKAAAVPEKQKEKEAEEEEEEEEQGLYLPLPPKKPKLVLPSQTKDKRTVNTLIEDIQSFTPESVPRTQMQDPKQLQSTNTRRKEEYDEDQVSEDSLFNDFKAEDMYTDSDIYDNQTKSVTREQQKQQQGEEEGNDDGNVYDFTTSNTSNNGGTEQNSQGMDEPLVTQRIPLAEQMIPGPAGGLNVKKDEKSDLGESIDDVMRPGFPYNTERDGSKRAFLSQAWVRMLHDNNMYPFGSERANTNVRYVNK